MLPDPTPRLRFRQMRPADVDDLAALLGDAEAMRFYPAPLTREQADAWIGRNLSSIPLRHVMGMRWGYAAAHGGA